MEKRVIKFNGNEIYYFLDRKKIKNINIRIKPDGNIYMSCPMRMSIEKAEAFLISKYNWISKNQEKIKMVSNEKEVLKDNGLIYYLGKKYGLRIIPSKQNKIEIKNDKIVFEIKEKYYQNTNYIMKYYEKFLKEKTYDVCKYFIEKYSTNNPQIEVKKLKTRWGSCTPKKNKVAFNMCLIKTPIQCIEYVVVHELSHFRHPNHSKMFYDLVESYIPDWKSRRKLLNDKYSIVI